MVHTPDRDHRQTKPYPKPLRIYSKCLLRQMGGDDVVSQKGEGHGTRCPGHEHEAPGSYIRIRVHDPGPMRNFLELRQREVRRILLPRTPLNRDHEAT